MCAERRALSVGVCLVAFQYSCRLYYLAFDFMISCLILLVLIACISNVVFCSMSFVLCDCSRRFDVDIFFGLSVRFYCLMSVFEFTLCSILLFDFSVRFYCSIFYCY